MPHQIIDGLFEINQATRREEKREIAGKVPGTFFEFAVRSVPMSSPANYCAESCLVTRVEEPRNWRRPNRARPGKKKGGILPTPFDARYGIAKMSPVSTPASAAAIGRQEGQW